MGIRAWTDAELDEAIALNKGGMPWREVGKIFGRSRSATQAAAMRYQGHVPTHRDDSYVGPPIGRTMECARLEKDARLGSKTLREACLDLFQRTANRYQINLNDAMACHLGYYAPPTRPGRERPFVSRNSFGLAA